MTKKNDKKKVFSKLFVFFCKINRLYLSIGSISRSAGNRAFTIFFDNDGGSSQSIVRSVAFELLFGKSKRFCDPVPDNRIVMSGIRFHQRVLSSLPSRNVI